MIPAIQMNERRIAMNTTNQTKAHIIAGKYGFLHQREIFVEECAEAIQAVQKYKRNITAENMLHIAEEVADVIIMAEQIKHLIGDDTVETIIAQKLDRQLKRIEVEELC